MHRTTPPFSCSYRNFGQIIGPETWKALNFSVGQFAVDLEDEFGNPLVQESQRSNRLADVLERMDVFISYVGSDGDVAQRLTNDLLRRGFEVWPENEDSALPTENFFELLTTLIESSKVFLALVSAESNQDQFAANELAVALAAVQANPGIALIPVVVQQDALVLPPLDQHPVIDLSSTQTYEVQFARLLALMHEKTGIAPSDQATSGHSAIDLVALSFLLTMIVGAVALRGFGELPAWTFPYLGGIITGTAGVFLFPWLARRRAMPPQQ